MYRWRATFLKHAFLHSIKPLRTAAFSAKVLLQNSFFQKSYFCKTAYFSEKQDSAGPTSGELLSQNGWLFKAAICNVCSGPFFKAVCYFILKEQLRSPILSNRPDFFIISDGVIHFLVFQSSNLYLSGDRWQHSKHINAESTLKKRRLSAFINVISKLEFGWKWKLSRRIFIYVVSTLTNQRWNFTASVKY